MKQAVIAVAAWAAAMLGSAALAEDYADGWGLAVGAKAPAIQAQDQGGALRDLASLGGRAGVAADREPLRRLVTLLQAPVGSTGSMAGAV